MKRALLLFAACLLSAVLTGQSTAAGTYKILKPTIFSRSTGTPVEQRKDFASPFTDSKARLIISNGDADGNHRVSSAAIIMNGRQVAGPSDFSNKIAKIEKIVPVALSNTLSVQIAATPGDFFTITVEGTPPPPVIKITTPLDQSQTDKPFTMVNGEVLNGFGEFGVTVNGIPAQVMCDTFFVNNVPLTEGTNTINAVVTRADGDVAESSITVTADTTGKEWLELSLNPETGMSDPGANPPKPFTATLRVNPHLANNSNNWSWDLLYAYSGTGTSQVQMTLDSSSDDALEHQLSFNDPGVYKLSFTIATDNGPVYIGETMVNMLDRTSIDSTLGQKWQGMRSALLAQDVEDAVSYFRGPAQDNYRRQFNQLKLGFDLPGLIAEMKDIELIYVKNNRAKYRINRDQVIDGIPETVTYYIYFVLDDNGLWKIEQF